VKCFFHSCFSIEDETHLLMLSSLR